MIVDSKIYREGKIDSLPALRGIGTCCQIAVLGKFPAKDSVYPASRHGYTQQDVDELWMFLARLARSSFYGKMILVSDYSVYEQVEDQPINLSANSFITFVKKHPELGKVESQVAAPRDHMYANPKYTHLHTWYPKMTLDVKGLYKGKFENTTTGRVIGGSKGNDIYNHAYEYFVNKILGYNTDYATTFLQFFDDRSDIPYEKLEESHKQYERFIHPRQAAGPTQRVSGDLSYAAGVYATLAG